MMLIEGEELKQIIIGFWNDVDRYVDGDISLSDIIGIIDDMPTIEPESQIVRCKDCKWRNVYQFPPKYDERDYCDKHEKNCERRWLLLMGRKGNR